MCNIKNQRGITILTLAITVAVLAILFAVSVSLGDVSVNETKDSKLTTDLNIVQHAVIEQYSKFKLTKNISYLAGTKMESNEINDIANQLGINLVKIPDTYSNADYYKLSLQDLASIGIENAEDEYIVNYVTGEVINITKKITSDGKPLYTRAVGYFNE